MGDEAFSREAEQISAGDKGRSEKEGACRHRRFGPNLCEAHSESTRVRKREVKRMLKKIGWAVAALVGAAVVAFCIFVLPFMIQVWNFTPAHTGKVADDLYAVSDKMVSMFVLKSGDDLIAFDAGNDIDHVASGFKELGFDPAKVKAVFLTHSDSDHVRALPLFKNATVYLPEKEEPLVTGQQKRKFLIFSRINALPVSAYTLIADGKEISFGASTIKAYLTPGHTIGSTSYLINGKYLATGDLALVKEGKLVPMPKPPSENMEALNTSLTKVNALHGVEMVLTAHAGVLSY
jgi:metallo-beta-lactamase class B